MIEIEPPPEDDFVPDNQLTIVTLASIATITHRSDLDYGQMIDQMNQIFDASGWTVYHAIRKLDLDNTPYLPEGFSHDPRSATSETNHPVSKSSREDI